MIHKEPWMREVVVRLQRQFGDRLLFVGLQGSYLRNEATETSDFDVMVVLDALNTRDLDAYRAIVREMPESEKACGFVSGRAELLNWPAYEIFQLRQGTKAYFGRLDGLLPAYTQADIRQSVQIAAANLYHAACHQYLFGEESARAEDLRPLCKSIFFVLQLVEYLRLGQYHATRAELLGALSGGEKTLLETGMNWDAARSAVSSDPAVYYEMLIEWCRSVLCDAKLSAN